MSNSEELALASIAEVITEARALNLDDSAVEYNEALIDLTMARLRPDVAFLILGAEIEGEPYVEAPRPSNGKVATDKWWIIDHPNDMTVVHVNRGCYFLSRSTGYHLADAWDVANRDKCARCGT